MQYDAPTAVEYLRCKDAAKFLNVSYAYFRTLGIPAIKLGLRGKAYSVSTLRAWMAAREGAK